VRIIATFEIDKIKKDASEKESCSIKMHQLIAMIKMHELKFNLLPDSSFR